MKVSVSSFRRPGNRGLAAIALSLALYFVAVGAASADGLTWRSYAELGPGCSFVGGGVKSQLEMDVGIILGSFELGARYAAVPFEFGSPDLIQVGAARWGATLGYRPKLDWALSPFARIGVGQVGMGRVPEGGGDMTDLSKDFDLSAVLGASLPIGGRWSALAWGAYDWAPGAEDYDGRSLSGFSAGLAIRATWETTVR
jgi:hypothetical protein